MRHLLTIFTDIIKDLTPLETLVMLLSPSQTDHKHLLINSFKTECYAVYVLMLQNTENVEF